MFACYCSSAVVHVDPRDIQAHIDIILRAAKLGSVEKLAIALRLDETQLRRQIAGEGHLSLTRIIATLGKEDRGFYGRYAVALVEAYGLPREARRTALLWLSTLGRRRPLSVAAKEPQKRSA